jgi:poly(ADP-ribose) glycohydrolase
VTKIQLNYFFKMNLPIDDKNKWENIVHLLSNKIESLDKFKEIISNFSDGHPFSFKLLDNYVKEKQEYFFETLEKIQKYVLEMPELFLNQIPFLISSEEEEIQCLKISKLQVRCLLASCFFLLLESANKTTKQRNFPETVNFDIFYLDSINQSNLTKLECLLHYFNVSDSNLKGDIVIQRKKLKEKINWKDSTEKLTKLEIIEDRKVSMFDFENYLQTDFSNRLIGGGVLGGGCYQEEILFVIRPECLVSLLLCSAMEENESILISGTNRFSSYSGFGMKFKFEGGYKIMDSDSTEIVAIDALPQANSYIPKNMLRELNKAYAGYSKWNQNKPLITGNWGCGAYAGDKQVMSMVQLLACAKSNRDLIYHTYGDFRFQEDLQEIYDFLVKKNVTIGEIWTIMSEGFQEELNNFENCSGRLFDKFKDSLKK